MANKWIGLETNADSTGVNEKKNSSEVIFYRVL